MPTLAADCSYVKPCLERNYLFCLANSVSLAFGSIFSLAF
jgi:hypothetical protein